MVQVFADHLRNKIKEDRDNIVVALIAGQAASYDEYRHMTGRIRELDAVQQMVDDLMDAYTKE